MYIQYFPIRIRSAIFDQVRSVCARILVILSFHILVILLLIPLALVVPLPLSLPLLLPSGEIGARDVSNFPSPRKHQTWPSHRYTLAERVSDRSGKLRVFTKDRPIDPVTERRINDRSTISAITVKRRARPRGNIEGKKNWSVQLGHRLAHSADRGRLEPSSSELPSRA